MKLSEKILIILNSDISGYEIEKKTKLNASRVYNIRKGKQKVSGISLGIAETIGDLYDEKFGHDE